jgi:hypothetical protein
VKRQKSVRPAPLSREPRTPPAPSPDPMPTSKLLQAVGQLLEWGSRFKLSLENRERLRAREGLPKEELIPLVDPLFAGILTDKISDVNARIKTAYEGLLAKQKRHASTVEEEQDDEW